MARDLQDIDIFRDFYGASLKRLTKRAAAFNDHLMKEEHPLLVPFMEDFADLNTGGKMLRGMLVNLGYRLAGNDDIQYSDALSIAFELFQTGVLIHDDVIDNASLRRGKMTAHLREKERIEARNIRTEDMGGSSDSLGRSTAICLGDLGLYYANLELAEKYGDDPNFASLITYFDKVILETIRGELLDVVLPYEMQDPTMTESEKDALLMRTVKDIYYLKTAHYTIIGPLGLGLRLGGADKKLIAAMEKYGKYVGIAFQIKDDILGIYADEATLGKNVGSDISEFKQTILYQYVCTEQKDYMEELLAHYGKADLTAEDIEAVRDIFRKSGALDYATEAMEHYYAKARKTVASLSSLTYEDRAILRGFVDYCSQRTY